MPDEPDPIRMRDALLREDLSSFIIKSFHTIRPGIDYLHNWHIDVIAEHLQACTEGEIKRLIINMPPRYLKSHCVSVAWSAWVLGRKPEERIIAASYAQPLSLKHSLDCRAVMEAPWYQRLFPETQFASDQNEKAKFMTTQRGFRFATSVGGAVTGEGGNILIVDDPHNPLQAHSHLQRQHALDWFDHTFYSRLDDKTKGCFVIVMQRLHEMDLTGYLLGKSKLWHQLSLPAIMDQSHRYWAMSDGGILHAARESKEQLEQLQSEMGSFNFAAQYQQQPMAEEGNIIRQEWLKYYQHLPEALLTIQSWDTAIKTGLSNDYSVCTTWVESSGGYYLADVSRARMEYPELLRQVVNLSHQYQPDAILIEDKASGQSLLQHLRKETQLPLIPILPKQDKQTRFMAITPLFEAGQVWLPTNALWLSEYVEELMRFPNVAHDDQADSTSQALEWLRNRNRGEARIRGL